MAIYVPQKFHCTSVDGILVDAFQIFDNEAQFGEKEGYYQHEINNFILSSISRLEGIKAWIITNIEFVNKNDKDENGIFLKMTYSDENNLSSSQVIYSGNLNLGQILEIVDPTQIDTLF